MRTPQQLTNEFMDGRRDAAISPHDYDLLRGLFAQCQDEVLSQQPPEPEPDRVMVTKEGQVKVKVLGAWEAAGLTEIQALRFRDELRDEGRKKGLKEALEKLHERYDSSAACVAIIEELKSK